MTYSEDASRGIIAKQLSSDTEEIIHRINKIFISHAFDNDHVLAVWRLSEIASEEYRFFLDVINSADIEAVSARGAQRAKDGICIDAVLDMVSFWTRYFLEKIDRPDQPTVQKTALQCLSDYSKAYIKGFFEEYPKDILKQQQDIRQALTAALEGQQEELFVRKHSIDSSINAILLADLSGTVTYVNPSFLNMWGYKSSNEVLSIRSIGRVTGREVEKIFKSLPEAKSWRGELNMVRKDKTEFDVEMLASLIIDVNGHIYGSMASFVDITERKRIESQFRNSRKMDALGQLAAGITHDFNNMFAVVRGYVQLILRESAKGSQLYDDINQIKVAVERSSGLTKQLQYFARGVGGEYATVSLNSIVKECRTLLKHSISPDIETVLDLENDTWLLEADPSQLSQVVINLCVNAQDAIIEKDADKWNEELEDNTRGKITIKTQNVEIDEKTASLYLKAKPGRYILLSVSDTGIGMTSEVMEKLFEPFYSTKKNKKHSGLGLPIIYGIIEKLGGFVDVQSLLGKGSTFNIYLPATEGCPADAAKEKNEPLLAAEEKTVLVVDDEQQLLNVLQRFLLGCGYKVMTAKNGKEALASYQEARDQINLVIMDVVMPEMGGEKCLRQMLKINPDVRVILITGFTTDEDIYEMARNKVVEIVEKPFDLYKIASAVKNALK